MTRANRKQFVQAYVHNVLVEKRQESLEVGIKGKGLGEGAVGIVFGGGGAHFSFACRLSNAASRRCPWRISQICLPQQS